LILLKTVEMLNFYDLYGFRFDYSLGLDADELPEPAAITKFHDSGNAGKQSVVLPDANVFARFILGAALANQNGTAGHDFAAESLDTETLSVRIPTILRTA
jgi:hypothetical protein